MILTNIAKKALLMGLKNALNQGGDNFATLCFYDSDNNLLAQCPIDNNDGVIVTGQLKFTPSGQTSIAKSGTLAMAKIYDGAGNLLIDGLLVGTENTDIIVDKMAVQVGGYVSVVSVIFQF